MKRHEDPSRGLGISRRLQQEWKRSGWGSMHFNTTRRRCLLINKPRRQQRKPSGAWTEASETEATESPGGGHGFTGHSQGEVEKPRLQGWGAGAGQS